MCIVYAAYTDAFQLLFSFIHNSVVFRVQSKMVLLQMEKRILKQQRKKKLNCSLNDFVILSFALPQSSDLTYMNYIECQFCIKYCL